jgi:hypothetical protein
MSNETTDNFLKVMATFEWPDPAPVSYRLYYNDNGTPKCYSMEHMPDKYIEVDAETFALRPWNVRVIGEKLTVIHPPVTVQKLHPNQETGTRCHPLDVCVVVSEQDPHVIWNKITNEIY